MKRAWRRGRDGLSIEVLDVDNETREVRSSKILRFKTPMTLEDAVRFMKLHFPETKPEKA